MQESTERMINGLFLVMVIVLIFNFFYRDEISNEQREQRYESYLRNNLNDKTSIYLANLCKYSSNQVSCVMKETKDITIYVAEPGRKKPKKPSDYVVEGGDCKDSAIFYATIFSELGYDVKFRFPLETHVSITISKSFDGEKNYYCDIESDSYDCHWVMSA